MTTPALYQLTGEWLALANRLSDLDMDAQTISDTLEGSDEQMAIEVKLQGYEMVARTIEAPVSAIDVEIARLMALRAAVLKRSEALRARMFDSMVAMGVQKITCPLFQISRRKNPEKVVVFEQALIPAEFMRTPEPPPHPEPSPDKAAIKEALKAGKDVQGARLERTERLVVQ